MLTPLDIENKIFSKSVRGYNANEVDAFLDDIILDMQTLITENGNLKRKNADYEEEIARCRKSELSVLNTLDSAKKLMTDISESAEKRAEVILKNAQLDADAIKRDAEDSVTRLTEESRQLAQKVAKFKERYRNLLEEELKNIDNNADDIFAEFNEDFRQQPPDEDKAQPDRITDDDTKVMTKDTADDTIVINEKNIEEMLMDDFSDLSDSESASSDDLTKTIII